MDDSKRYNTNYSRIHMNFFKLCIFVYLKSYLNNDLCRGIECHLLVIDIKSIINEFVISYLENISPSSTITLNVISHNVCILLVKSCDSPVTTSK